MNNKNILALAVLAATTVTSVNVMAEEKVNVQVTTEVSNAFELLNPVGLNFGQIRATAVSDSVATYALPANSAQPIVPGDDTKGAVIQGLDDTATAATFTITGVADYAVLSITVPTDADATPISHSQPGATGFTLTGFTVYADNTDIDVSTGTGSLTALGDGTLAFTLGATLNTDKSAGVVNYIDGPYTGNFDVTVSY